LATEKLGGKVVKKLHFLGGNKNFFEKNGTGNKWGKKDTSPIFYLYI